MKEKPLKIPYIFCNNIYFCRSYILKDVRSASSDEEIILYIY